MKWIFLLAAFLSATTAHAADPWTPAQKALGATSTALLVVDWGQTLDVQKHPHKDGMAYTESNHILGAHPSRGQINTYFASAIVGNLAIAHLLPSKWRTGWLASVTVVEVVVTNHNRQLGVGISF